MGTEYYGCGDGGCIVQKPRGMHTNGGCDCLSDIRNPDTRVRLRKGIHAIRTERDAAIARAEQAERERDVAYERGRADGIMGALTADDSCFAMSEEDMAADLGLETLDLSALREERDQARAELAGAHETKRRAFAEAVQAGVALAEARAELAAAEDAARDVCLALGVATFGSSYLADLRLAAGKANEARAEVERLRLPADVVQVIREALRHADLEQWNGDYEAKTPAEVALAAIDAAYGKAVESNV